MMRHFGNDAFLQDAYEDALDMGMHKEDAIHYANELLYDMGKLHEIEEIVNKIVEGVTLLKS